jgi:hypothetical protein
MEKTPINDLVQSPKEAKFVAKGKANSSRGFVVAPSVVKL